MTEYNRPPVINPIPTTILAIFSGIVLFEAFIFFGFGDPLGNSGVAAKRMLLYKNMEFLQTLQIGCWKQVISQMIMFLDL